MNLEDKIANDIIIITLEGEESNKQQIRNSILTKHILLQSSQHDVESLIDIYI